MKKGNLISCSLAFYTKYESQVSKHLPLLDYVAVKLVALSKPV